MALIEYDKAKLRISIFPQQHEMTPNSQIKDVEVGQESFESNLFFHWEDFHRNEKTNDPHRANDQEIWKPIQHYSQIQGKSIRVF